jgi:hypothetical protein
MILALALAAGTACTGGAADIGGTSAAGGSGGASGSTSTGGTHAGGAPTGGSGGAGGVTTGGAGGGSASWIWAITVDDPWTDRPALLDSLASLQQYMTVRVVLDEGMAAAEYDQAVRDIATVAAVQGELVDSLYVPDYSLAQYVARANEYLDQLGDVVSLWEVGNEINGEWLGPTADVVAKMTAAYEEVTARGGRTALTLYYNEECWAKPANEVFTWAAANVPASLKQGLDYVFFSYYEDDCNGLQPDWPTQFARLATMFPNSRLGFGECGTTNAASKATYVTRYYTMSIAEPRYVGGYFWWYYWEDMVPYTKPLWTVLDDALASQ